MTGTGSRREQRLPSLSNHPSPSAGFRFSSIDSVHVKHSEHARSVCHEVCVRASDGRRVSMNCVAESCTRPHRRDSFSYGARTPRSTGVGQQLDWSGQEAVRTCSHSFAQRQTVSDYQISRCMQRTVREIGALSLHPGSAHGKKNPLEKRDAHGLLKAFFQSSIVPVQRATRRRVGCCQYVCVRLRLDTTRAAR